MAANDTPKALMEALDPIWGTRGPNRGRLTFWNANKSAAPERFSKTATSSLSESPKGASSWPDGLFCVTYLSISD